MRAHPYLAGSGSAALLIGSPVTAEISVSPDILPPGHSTVTHTLTITGQPSSDNGDDTELTLVGQLPIDDPDSNNDFNADNIHGVEVLGDVVYVFGDRGLHVVDAENPAAPQFLTTKTGFQHTEGFIDAAHNRIVAIDDGTFSIAAVASNSVLVTYDIGTGTGTIENPQRTGVAFPNYLAANSAFINAAGDTAFVGVGILIFPIPPAGQQGDFRSQHGTLLSFDLTGSLSSTPLDSLLDDNGPNGQPPFNQNGGNHYVSNVILADDTTAYLASTTGEGGDVDTDATGNPAVGRIMLADISDPNNLSFVGDQDPTTTGLQIPGTMLLSDIVVDGDVAFVTGSTGTWKEPFDTVEDIGPDGDIVVAVLDVSDVRNPQLLGTQALPRSARGASPVVSLGNGLIAFSSLGSLTDTPQLFVVDASDPDDIQVVVQMEIPAHAGGAPL